MFSALVGIAPRASNVVMVPSGVRTQLRAPLLLAYHPVIAPAGLMLVGIVPWNAPVPAPGASNVVKGPSEWRRKPCTTLLASKKYPVIAPAGLMAWGTVDMEPGGSKVM